MNRPTRRALGIGSLTLLLARCGNVSISSTALTTAEDTASTIITSAITEAKAINLALPTVLTNAQLALLTNANGTGWLDLASVELTNLKGLIGTGVTDLTGATTLQKIEDYINDALPYLQAILTTAGAVWPGLSAAQAVVEDIILAYPIIEDFVNSVLASTKVSAMPPSHRIAALAAVADLKARMKQ